MTQDGGRLIPDAMVEDITRPMYTLSNIYAALGIVPRPPQSRYQRIVSRVRGAVWGVQYRLGHAWRALRGIDCERDW